MTGAGDERGRRLESDESQAASSPAAVHGDALSPAQALRESVNATGSQRVGSSPPLANPVASFPDTASDRDAREDRSSVSGSQSDPERPTDASPDAAER